MRLTVDRLNLLTSFKISRERPGARPAVRDLFLTPGKHIDFQCYERLAGAESLGDFAEQIGKTAYARVAAGLDDSAGGGLASVRLERAIDREILRWAGIASLPDDRGPGLMIHYLLRKWHEIINLRILARGKAYGVHPADLQAILVF